MGIRFQCPNGHKLNVKADLAGKRASCPECGAKLVIPAASPKPPARLVAASAAQRGNPPGPPTHAWHVRPAGGGQLGPATDAMFRAWIAEGRVTAASQVRRDDWADWKLARDAVGDLPIPLAAVPVATSPMPATAIPPMPPLDAPADESSPTGTIPTPSTPLAAARYQLQRRKMQKTQLALAIVMLVAVIVLAGVLVWVIRKGGNPTGTASIQTTTRTEVVDRGRPTLPSEAT
jgi:hypothetical protein